MLGQLLSATWVYDNAAEFVLSIPTYAHHLRGTGYQTSLVGEMHFAGPDQLHGFEQRLTKDVYPADFGWIPDYRQAGDRIYWRYHNMGSATGAGVGETSNQLEYDDEVAYHATGKLYDLACGVDNRPWCLKVSSTHPHDPDVARKKYWDLHTDCAHLLSEFLAIPYADQDANYWLTYEVTNDQIKALWRAYFANIGYLDDKIGEVLEVLKKSAKRQRPYLCLTMAICWVRADCGLRCRSTKVWRGCN
jgi:choline-sulfatase